MKVNFGISTEWLFQDWKEKRRQEKEGSMINTQDVKTMLTALQKTEDEIINKMLSEKVLKAFGDCGYLMKYFYTIHFNLQNEVKKSIVPILKKYESITSADLKVDYDNSNNSKIEQLEESVSSAWKSFEKSEIYKSARDYLAIPRKSSPTFKDIKVDKPRLKDILELFIKYSETDYDKMCDLFIFAEDHDDGFWYIYSKLEKLVDDFRTPDGLDAEMEDFFKGYTTAIGACLVCQTCFNKWVQDLIWIVKRSNIIMRRYGILQEPK